MKIKKKINNNKIIMQIINKNKKKIIMKMAMKIINNKKNWIINQRFEFQNFDFF